MTGESARPLKLRVPGALRTGSASAKVQSRNVAWLVYQVRPRPSTLASRVRAAGTDRYSRWAHGYPAFNAVSAPKMMVLPCATLRGRPVGANGNVASNTRSPLLSAHSLRLRGEYEGSFPVGAPAERSRGLNSLSYGVVAERQRLARRGDFAEGPQGESRKRSDDAEATVVRKSPPSYTGNGGTGENYASLWSKDKLLESKRRAEEVETKE